MPQRRRNVEFVPGTLYRVLLAAGHETRSTIGGLVDVGMAEEGEVVDVVVGGVVLGALPNEII